METLTRNIRFAFRSLRKNPTFSAVATLTLALAIGVNTAIFSIVGVIVFADLPMQETESVAVVRAVNPALGVDQGSVSVPDFLDLRERATSYDGLAALDGDRWVLTGGDVPVRIDGLRITANTFDVWRLPAVAGRSFLSDEDLPGGARVAMISYPFWQSNFSGGADAVGSTLKLDGEVYEIVGVANPKLGFADFGRAQVLLPLVLDGTGALRDDRRLFVSGRLAPGVTHERATQEAAAIGRALAEEHPDVAAGWSLWSAPAMESLLGNEGRVVLLMLILTVSFVILIACANLANMLLARATVRAREMSVRAALGAGRGRLVGQLLTESFVISMVSAVLGFGFAKVLMDFLTRVANGTEEVFNMARMDGRVMAFTLLVALVAPLVFGLLPALRTSGDGPAGVLREGRSTGGARAGKRTRNVLAGAQVSLALSLMIVAGLLARTVANLTLRDPGFDPAGIVTVSLDVSDGAYPDDAGRVRFYEAAREALAGIPSVTGTALTNVIPGAGFGQFRGIRIEGREVPRESGLPTVEVVTVSSDFTSLLGLRVLRGRALDLNDGPDATRVALVAKDVAELHWPGEDPIGRRFQLGSDEGAPWVQVVGVVADVGPSTDSERPAPYVYVPHAQNALSAMTVLARSDADPAGLGGRIREAILAVDADQPVDRILTVEQAQYDNNASSVAVATLFVIFAVFALAMAALGIYGVMSYSVSRRAGEIGLRMALGARAAEVRAMVVGQGMKVVVAGMAVGLVAAWGLSRVLAGVVFGISPTDPVTFLGVPALLVMVALLATWIPAVRATRAEPAKVLRAE
jgi:putative ABC transport system permease protein